MSRATYAISYQLNQPSFLSLFSSSNISSISYSKTLAACKGIGNSMVKGNAPPLIFSCCRF